MSSLPYFCDTCIGDWGWNDFLYRLVARKSAGRINGLHANISASFRFTCQKIHCIGQAGLRAGRFSGRASKPAGAPTGQNIIMTHKAELGKAWEQFPASKIRLIQVCILLCKCKLASRIHSYRIYPWSLNQSLLSTSSRFIPVFIARTPPSSTLLSSPLLSSISAVLETICA